MKRIVTILAIVLNLLMAAPAAAQSDNVGCIEMPDGPERDQCLAAAVANVLSGTNASTGTQNWSVRTSTSAIDDSKSVFIHTTSTNDIPARFGGSGPAELMIRCMENTTSAIFNFNGNFMADLQSYGRVTYRVDSRTAKTVSMQESTNNEALGLWRGGQSIPFIRELLGANTLVVRATPYNQSSVEVTFNIAGLDQHLDQLREACHW